MKKNSEHSDVRSANKRIMDLLFLPWISSIKFVINILIFLKSPVIRYHHTLFILFALSFIILINNNFEKKIFLFKIIIVLLLVFNFSKNFQRIYETNFINNPYDHIKKVKWYREPVEKQISGFKYYNGWIDRYPIGNMDLSLYKYKKIFFFDMIYKW